MKIIMEKNFLLISFSFISFFILIMDEKEYKELLEILERLHLLCVLDMAGDGVPEYEKGEQRIHEIIIKNIKHIKEIIDSLDFNIPEQRHILRYVPDIVLKLDNLFDQVMLVTSIKIQKDKYPDVNFGFWIFYSKLGYKVEDRCGEKEEEEEEE